MACTFFNRWRLNDLQSKHKSSTDQWCGYGGEIQYVDPVIYEILDEMCVASSGNNQRCCRITGTRGWSLNVNTSLKLWHNNKRSTPQFQRNTFNSKTVMFKIRYITAFGLKVFCASTSWRASFYFFAAVLHLLDYIFGAERQSKQGKEKCHSETAVFFRR